MATLGLQKAAQGKNWAFKLACVGWLVTGILPRLTAAEGDFFKSFFDHELKVITVTDVTDVGKKMAPATKEYPVYFEALLLGYKDWGKAIAGEKIPDKKAMLRVILKVLAEQGYYPCTKLHKPTLLLALAWGSMNQAPGVSLSFMGGDKMDLLWGVGSRDESAFSPHSWILQMISRSSPEWIAFESSQGNLYVASIQAFDEAEALKGRTRLLWHTKISCPADGLYMDSTLKQMVHIAGPNIGRETARPVITSALEHNATVEIGEVKVLDTIDDPNLPVTDLSAPVTEKPEAAK